MDQRPDAIPLHFSQHHLPPLYICYPCSLHGSDFSSTDPAELDSHLLLSHEEVRGGIQCSVCFNRFPRLLEHNCVVGTQMFYEPIVVQPSPWDLAEKSYKIGSSACRLIEKCADKSQIPRDVAVRVAEGALWVSGAAANVTAKVTDITFGLVNLQFVTDRISASTQQGAAYVHNVDDHINNIKEIAADGAQTMREIQNAKRLSRLPPRAHSAGASALDTCNLFLDAALDVVDVAWKIVLMDGMSESVIRDAQQATTHLKEFVEDESFRGLDYASIVTSLAVEGADAIATAAAIIAGASV